MTQEENDRVKGIVTILLEEMKEIRKTAWEHDPRSRTSDWIFENSRRFDKIRLEIDVELDLMTK